MPFKFPEKMAKFSRQIAMNKINFSIYRKKIAGFFFVKCNLRCALQLKRNVLKNPDLSKPATGKQCQMANVVTQLFGEGE